MRRSARGRAVITALYARGQKGTGIDLAVSRYRRVQVAASFRTVKVVNKTTGDRLNGEK